ncbi:ribonuclease P protein component [Candidatus Wolfebacteria bacterium]|nr:ribonuclease P protein component [Candidatus Wolfebacteria bacterium]
MKSFKSDGVCATIIQMLAKKYKLPIKEFLDKKPRISGRTEFFLMRILPNNLKFSRFGVVISKKVSASAVVRNKIKRTIFDFLRIEKLHIPAGKDVLLTVLPPAAKLNKKELEEGLENVIIKL